MNAMLDKNQIQKLLDLVGREEVASFGGRDKRDFVVTRRVAGYSEDGDTARLQAALSLMLEAAR